MAERSPGGDRAPVCGGAGGGADLPGDAGGDEDREHQAREASERRAQPGAGVQQEIGARDMPTPPHVVEAGVRALKEGRTRYALAAGVPELRDAIARSVAGGGVRAGAENVVVTPGAKPMLFSAALALIEPGDEVLCPDPGFPIYESVVRFAGGHPRYYPLHATRDCAPHLAVLAARITPATRTLILHLPHNPTGGVATGGGLAAPAEMAPPPDPWGIPDEGEGPVPYAAPHDSIARRPGPAGRPVAAARVS